eukprot:8657191-Heterocapsa_arctica.AAC.1
MPPTGETRMFTPRRGRKGTSLREGSPTRTTDPERLTGERREQDRGPPHLLGRPKVTPPAKRSSA